MAYDEHLADRIRELIAPNAASRRSDVRRLAF